MAPRRRTSLALAVLLVLAGCLGSASAPEATSPGQTPTDVTTSQTTTTAVEPAAETTTRRACSLDVTASTLSNETLSNATFLNVSKPANLTVETARNVAETVESRYQSARVEAHSYFNYHASVESVTAVEGGYRVVLAAELDYDSRGSENATVTHVHRPYTVAYLVTDRQVVRRGEAGVTGTVACW